MDAYDALGDLQRRFPRLMTDGPDPYNVSHGKGWHPIVVALMERIDTELDDQEAAAFRLFQIKEKFGGLRFYYSFHLPQTDDLDEESTLAATSALRRRLEPFVDEAKSQCDRTCESCGAPGSLDTSGGWDRTLCGNCSRQRKEALR